ncbi:hypothetical protein SMICM17S_04406 [Streptomyces microflavus]
MADHQEATVTLPSDPVSVSSARRYVARTLAEWGLSEDTELADTIRLIISELATNAVQHTFGQSPTFTVDLRLERDEELRLAEVRRDSHRGRPRKLPAAARQDKPGPGPQGKSVRPVGQRTRPYQTLLDQIFAFRTTSPDLGECQIFPPPA